MDLDRVETLCRLFAIGVRHREKKMQRTGFGKQLAGALAKDDNGVASVELVHLGIVWG